MTFTKPILFLALAAGISACDKQDLSVDRAIDSHHLSTLEAGIWIDPRGCDHWIIDDGVEGYLTTRLDRYGRPVCSGVGPPETAVGLDRGWDPI